MQIHYVKELYAIEISSNQIEPTKPSLNNVGSGNDESQIEQTECSQSLSPNTHTHTHILFIIFIYI